MIKPNMTNKEVFALYPEHKVGFMDLEVEDYKMPKYFEHRVEGRSLLCIYSMIRDYKPKNVLQIGTWDGGTSVVIASALKKNGKPFSFMASELLPDKLKNTRSHVFRETGVRVEMVGNCKTSIYDDVGDIDFFYHDTDHDYDTTVWVLDNIIPRLKDGALVIFHDWAVTEQNGKWIPKDGAWEETKYMCELHNNGPFPLKKVYWNYRNPNEEELGVFLYEKV